MMCKCVLWLMIKTLVVWRGVLTLAEVRRMSHKSQSCTVGIIEEELEVIEGARAGVHGAKASHSAWIRVLTCEATNKHDSSSVGDRTSATLATSIRAWKGAILEFISHTWLQSQRLARWWRRRYGALMFTGILREFHGTRPNFGPREIHVKSREKKYCSLVCTLVSTVDCTIPPV